MPVEATRAYHDLLLGDASLAADSQAALQTGQEARELYYARRPVCDVLRPRFLTPAQYRFLHDKAKALLPAFQAVAQRALADPAFRRQFRLADWEERLLEVDPGFREPCPISRLDAFFTSDSDLWFTEYNTEAPAGAGYSDSLTRMFHGIPVFQEFQRQFQVWPVLARPGVLHGLMDAFKQWRGGAGAAPRVAILDWRDAPTFAEFVLFYDYFKVMGLEARIVDPRDLEYRDGGLVAGDFRVTLVFNRVATDDLIARCGPDHPLFRAARERAACVVNSFHSRLLGKRAAVAVLSDERNADLFTAEQQAVIRAHVPWARLVEERATTGLDGRPVDLVPYILANKDALLLRPNDGHGAEGMVTGAAVGPDEWAAAVAGALARPHVVQRKVGLPSESYPLFEGGRLTIQPRCVDTSPFVAFGAFMHGCLTRISAEAPVNVAGGGAIVPTFVVEPR